MTWLRRYRLRAFLTTSLWFVPVLGMALALVAAPLIRRLDAATAWTLFGFGAEGARAVLTGLVASVFTFVVFVFSILLVAVQIASANLAPVIAGSGPGPSGSAWASWSSRNLGLAVGRIEQGASTRRDGGDLSSLASIVAFLYLIDHLARGSGP
jgi:hypothetical protein